MALKTHESVEELNKRGNQHLESTLEELAKIASEQASANTAGPPQPPLRGIQGFLSAFAKEVRKDFAGGK